LFYKSENRLPGSRSVYHLDFEPMWLDLPLLKWLRQNWNLTSTR